MNDASMTYKRVGDLELTGPDAADEHFGLQRFGWGVMAVILVLALAGGFGRGWLAQARVASATSGLQVEYDRLARADAPTELRLSIRSPPANEVELTFPSHYIARMQMESIVPPPRHARVGPRGITYAFGVGGDGPVAVVFAMKPRAAGRIDAAVALGADVPVTFRQFILP